MIIEAVAIFALLSAIFEFVVIMKLPMKLRIWCLEHGAFVHTIVFVINIAVHYGTVTGSMVAITAGLASFIAMPIAYKLTERQLIKEVEELKRNKAIIDSLAAQLYSSR